MIEDRLKQRLSETQYVMAFWPLPSEPDITGALRDLHKQGVTICLPGIEGDNITPYTVDDFSKLKPSSIGVHEPDTSSSEVFPYNRLDLVIVPGVAFSRCGDRLGRGGGYYDQFLGRLAPSIPRVAVAFEKQVFRSVPKEAHDIPMHSVITELNTHEREPER
jgi:5-formyltetrahydrofolate cyclo-ligase